VDALRERNLRRQLRQWLGLEANVRWECMLVTIRALQATDEQLTDRWQQVSSALIAHEMH
jgi:aminoglycoside phosphotransferase (APT) family kinase protein